MADARAIAAAMLIGGDAEDHGAFVARETAKLLASAEAADRSAGRLCQLGYRLAFLTWLDGERAAPASMTPAAEALSVMLAQQVIEFALNAGNDSMSCRAANLVMAQLSMAVARGLPKALEARRIRKGGDG